MLGQPPIVHLVDFVEDEVEQVESRDERRREINVGRDGQLGVVSTVDGVGGCEDRGTSIEGGDDTGLCDGDGLLFLHEALAHKVSENWGGEVQSMAGGM
jgi:hypothetical protein